MGDLTFGHPFDMLDTMEHHWAIQALNKGMSVIGLHLPLWLFRVLVAIPGGQKDFKTMLSYTKEEMLSRWKVRVDALSKSRTHIIAEAAV